MSKKEDHVGVAIKSTGTNNKAVIALSIALGCFAILFPKIFYPMYQGSTINSKSNDGKC